MPRQESDRAAAMRQRFVEDFRSRQKMASFTTKELARLMDFDASYISHVGRPDGHRPTREFAIRADRALRARGALLKLYEEYERECGGPRISAGEPELINVHEYAEQLFDGETFTITVERQLWNRTTEPVVQYPIKIAADETSDVILTWETIRLTAFCGDDPMVWRVDTDRFDFKEVRLLFENSSGKFPLEPGSTATIRYSYHVPADAWGTWFQRTILMPTKRLTVKLIFKCEHTPARVWSTEHSLEFGELPGGKIDVVRRGDLVIYTYEVGLPRRHARYRLAWHNGSFPDDDERPETGSPPLHSVSGHAR
jgi:hypothetical protein